MSRKPIITIDGPAGAGKSTTARLLAKRLGFIHIDTGAMYRAATLAVERSGCPLEEDSLRRLMDGISIILQHRNDEQRTILDAEDVTDEIRSPLITARVSAVSASPSVRMKMIEIQREMGVSGGVVMDGRDIGSIVFPNADLKIYLIASVEERVRRRLLEMGGSPGSLQEADLKAQIMARDDYDSNRTLSPLQKPKGAIEVDTTNLGLDDQVNVIFGHFQQLSGK